MSNLFSDISTVPLKKFTKKDRGSISVFLVLILFLVIGFLFALLESVRFQSAHYAMREASDAAMDSVLAGYQRELFEKYGLMFYDGSFGGGPLRTEMIEEEFALWFEKNADGSLLRLTSDRIHLNSVKTAADYNGFFFMESAVRYELLLEEAENGSIEHALSLENDRKSLLLRIRNLENLWASLPDPGQELSEDASETDAWKLIQEANRLRADSFRAVLKNDRPLSGTELPRQELPSVSFRDERIPEEGDGLMLTGTLTEEEKTALFHSYLGKYFPCYTDAQDEAGLFLEAEYLIFGQMTDEMNLRAAVSALLRIREAVNAEAIRSSAEEQRQIRALSEEYREAAGQDDRIEEKLLRACAFTKAVAETAFLLHGGELPFEAGAEAFSYRDYLEAHLLELDPADLSYRGLDMIQENLRRYGSDFLAGSLVYEMDFTVDARMDALFTRQAVFMNGLGKNPLSKSFSQRTSGSYR